MIATGRAKLPLSRAQDWASLVVRGSAGASPSLFEAPSLYEAPSFMGCRHVGRGSGRKLRSSDTRPTQGSEIWHPNCTMLPVWSSDRIRFQKSREIEGGHTMAQEKAGPIGREELI